MPPLIPLDPFPSFHSPVQLTTKHVRNSPFNEVGHLAVACCQVERLACTNSNDIQPSSAAVESTADLLDNPAAVPAATTDTSAFQTTPVSPSSVAVTFHLAHHSLNSDICISRTKSCNFEPDVFQSQRKPDNSLINSVASAVSLPCQTAPTTVSCRANTSVQTDDTFLFDTSSFPSEASILNTSPIKLNPSVSGSYTPNSALTTATLDGLQRQTVILARELSIQQSTVARLQEMGLRSREIILELLVEKSVLEKKATRKKVTENRLRLGHFVVRRQGANTEEKWVEGSRFKELDQLRKNIEVEREEIERCRKQWYKRKPLAGEGKKHSKSRSDEVSVDEFYQQLELFDLRKQMLSKEEKEIQMDFERLERERLLHVREMKRIINEEASRFSDHPLLHDRYLFLNLLGKGGFSEVHKGYDLVENRYVACKVHQLHTAWSTDKKENYMKHVAREINIHKTLEHPRIVKVYDVFDIGQESFCTVLEYIEGNDLDFFLKQNKCIPEREAKSLICQVVSALRYLNEIKPPVIHYDLKPGNILLVSGQVPGEIKITDFGLSKIMTEDEYNPETGMDLTSQGAGTYWYLPPECFEVGLKPPKISSKVDVWSVGVLFFQCLFGEKPFGNNLSQSDILQEHTILRARNINFPSTIKVSDGAKEFIRKCCTYEKDLRPDVFQICNDDYLKPKAQLRAKHETDCQIAEST
ncbi:unnamed protein product [Dicrocoelium dendriticum]|nr:unnamed protein product [Dicrocoelium dendriticum]